MSGHSIIASNPPVSPNSLEVNMKFLKHMQHSSIIRLLISLDLEMNAVFLSPAPLAMSWLCNTPAPFQTSGFWKPVLWLRMPWCHVLAYFITLFLWVFTYTCSCHFIHSLLFYFLSAFFPDLHFWCRKISCFNNFVEEYEVTCFVCF